MTDKHIPRYRQIADSLRTQIFQHGKASAQLETEAVLSKRFSVSSITVREALRLLRDEGLIERIQGKGTFISSNAVRKHVAIIARFEAQSIRISATNYDSLGRTLELLEHQGFSFRIYASQGGRNDEGADFRKYREFEEDLDKNFLQGVLIEPGAWLPDMLLRKLSAKGIPVVGAEGLLEHSISFNYTDALEQVVKFFAEKGKRRISFLYHQGASSPLYRDSNLRVETFKKCIRQYGLETREGWINSDVQPQEKESARQSFLSVWNCYSEKPDAVILFSEYFYKGVIEAISELGLNVPQSMIVAVHGTEQNDLIFPYPTLVFKTDPLAWAEKAVNRLCSLIHGVRIAKVNQWIPYRLVMEESIFPYNRTSIPVSSDAF